LARAQKHSKRKLSKWSALGGRPPAPLPARIAKRERAYARELVRRDKRMKTVTARFIKRLAAEEKKYDKRRAQYIAIFTNETEERTKLHHATQAERTDAQRRYYQAEFDQGVIWRKGKFDKIQENRKARLENRMANLRLELALRTETYEAGLVGLKKELQADLEALREKDKQKLAA
jgi:hypothetical protein